MRYAIFEDNMERLEKKLKRIGNKCAKYGNPFTYEKQEEEFRKCTNSAGEEEIRKFIWVNVEGEAKINNWEYVATISKTEKGNIIDKCSKTINIEVPHRYWDCQCICEHCGNKRVQTTYIIHNTETDEFKQVGKSCLADFTHGLSAEMVAQYISLTDELIQGEYIEPGYHGSIYYEKETFLMFVTECIEKLGYIKFDPYSSERSTKQTAVDFYNATFRPSIYSGYDKRKMEQLNFNWDTESNKATVKAALDWVEEQEAKTDYMHNLQVACALQYLSHENLGIIASLIPSFTKAEEKKIRDKKNAELNQSSVFVGAVGDRVEFDVESIRIATSWETEWGITYIYIINGTDGNIYTWKTSKALALDLVGHIKGTVKEHKEFREVKQTELTRCKCTEKKEVA